MINKLTKDQFIEKYGDVLVEFFRYYKYTFTYKGTLPDGAIITVDVGGDSAEIYRQEVVPGLKEPIRSLWPYSGSVYLNGESVESFYDF